MLEEGEGWSRSTSRWRERGTEADELAPFSVGAANNATNGRTERIWMGHAIMRPCQMIDLRADFILNYCTSHSELATSERGLRNLYKVGKYFKNCERNECTSCSI